jgi:GNAT superfamily N-acetyltransferase
VVGFADYGPYRGDDLANTGEVYALYLLSSHYRRGIGTALMEAALARMPQYGRHAVWVLEGNERAIAFYRSCGFAFDGARQTLTLGTEVTDLRMIRS